jgi:hypothetical protein
MAFICLLEGAALDRRHYPRWLYWSGVSLMLGISALYCHYDNVCYFKADIIQNQAREYFTRLVTRIESLPGFTATQRATTSAKVWNLQAGVKWPYDKAPQAGQTQGQAEVSGEGGRPTVVTMYDNHCCGWIFERDEEVAVTAATVEIKVTESEAEHNPHITLYGVKLTENTDGYKRYTEVFDDTVIGEADCVVGDVTYILINAAGKQLMNDRTIHGIGVRYDSEHVVFAKTAALLINNEAEETTPADEPAEQEGE